MGPLEKMSDLSRDLVCQLSSPICCEGQPMRCPTPPAFLGCYGWMLSRSWIVLCLSATQLEVWSMDGIFVMSTEIERKCLETFIAFWLSNFMSVESNSETIGLVLSCTFFFLFTFLAVLLYCIYKVSVSNELGKKWLFIKDSLKMTASV